jgi:predicted ATP-grasp superfamily ATP-dependent carboligase
MTEHKSYKKCALILGGHVNGYSIVKELFEQGIKEIALFDPGQSLARFSNKIKYCSVINNDPQTLLSELKKLNHQYDYIVIFPTDDLQLENLNKIYNDVESFCYLPFNKENLSEISNKYVQYQICKKIGIKYPKTFKIKTVNDLDIINQLKFPVLIKPSKKYLKIKLFRTLYLEERRDFFSSRKILVDYLNKNIEFILSEYIPGDDRNIYAYTCFRSQENKILNEWVGKKLSQHPDQFGNFSSSTNKFNLDVYQQGRLLVEALNAFGIIQPEFKYDYRDKSFKLMEVNLRSMMWHRTGSLCNVKLHETQFNYAVGKNINKYKQDQKKKYHFVLMIHEISNLIFRKGYWKIFKYNIYGGDKLIWAIFEWRDMKPFFYSLKLLIKLILAKCLKKLGLL